jgi:Cu/Ag efflux protein CusF
MKSLTEQLNMSTTKTHSTAISFDPVDNINYGEIIMLFCKNHNIDISKLADGDFDSAELTLIDFARFARANGEIVNFWIEV